MTYICLEAKELKTYKKTMLEESYVYKRLSNNGTIKKDLNSFLKYVSDCRELGFLAEDYTDLQKETYRRFKLANH